MRPSMRTPRPVVVSRTGRLLCSQGKRTCQLQHIAAPARYSSLTSARHSGSPGALRKHGSDSAVSRMLLRSMQGPVLEIVTRVSGISILEVQNN